MSPDTPLHEALTEYRLRVSILKKGYEQERYRIDVINRSDLGQKPVGQVTSVDIATYRDVRLASLNPKTKKLISPATVRLELSLLSNFFDIARIEWGICQDNPVKCSSTTSDYYTATLVTSHYSFVSAIVPPNSIYSVQLYSGTPTLITWAELR